MEKKEVEINDSSVCLVPGAGSVCPSVSLSVCLCVCGGCTRVLLARGLSTICTGQTDHAQSWTVLALVAFAFALLPFVWTVCYICRAQTIKIVWVTRLISLFPPPPPPAPYSLLLSPFFSRPAAFLDVCPDPALSQMSSESTA